jgi:hypothetical protein
VCAIELLLLIFCKCVWYRILQPFVYFINIWDWTKFMLSLSLKKQLCRNFRNKACWNFLQLSVIVSVTVSNPSIVFFSLGFTSSPFKIEKSCKIVTLSAIYPRIFWFPGIHNLLSVIHMYFSVLISSHYKNTARKFQSVLF